MKFTGVINRIYVRRYNEREREQRRLIWKVLCRSFLQRYIPREATVLDIGVGTGEFINQINCAKKIAVDLNDQNARFLNPEVQFYNASSSNIFFLTDACVDVVFLSNFLEHLRTKEEFVETILEINRVLKVGGRLLLMGPNIKYVYRDYWDFFDHHIPLSHLGVVELLESLGFICDTVLAKFLPYTVKSRLPKFPWAVRLYLAFPLIWQIMGQQMFISAHKSSDIEASAYR